MRREVLRYPEKYDFVGLMCDIFETRDLAKLGADEAGHYRIFFRDNDQSTIFHKTFYDRFDRAFRRTYEAFVGDWAAKQLGDADVLFQTVPTFRIHLPDNVAVGEFHRDGDYNHQQGEVNFWLPVTEAFDTNSLWVESEPGRGDFRAVRVAPGEVYVFDGVNLAHGNKVNRTGMTRVSVDFRLIPRHRFADVGRVSVSAGRQMAVGHYWSALRQDGAPCDSRL